MARPIPLSRRPASCSVQYAQQPHQLAGDVIDQNVVPMRDEFAHAPNPSGAANSRMVDQPGSTGGEQFIEGKSCRWRVGLDRVVDRLAVSDGLGSPSQFHQRERSRRRRVASRRAAKPRFNLIIGRQSPGVRRIEASLNLAAKPRVFLGRVLLLLDKVAHEIAQQLRASAITFLGCHGELLLQAVVDSVAPAPSNADRPEPSMVTVGSQRPRVHRPQPGLPVDRIEGFCESGDSRLRGAT